RRCPCAAGATPKASRRSSGSERPNSPSSARPSMNPARRPSASTPSWRWRSGSRWAAASRRSKYAPRERPVSAASMAATAPRSRAASGRTSERRVSGSELMVHLLVQQIVERGQQRQLLLLRVRRQPLGHFQPQGFQARGDRVFLYCGDEARRGRADGHVLFLQELDDVAFAGGGEAREELHLLEGEMALDLAGERCGSGAHKRGVAPSGGERSLEPGAQGEARLVLLVQAPADLTLEHLRPPSAAGRARAPPCLASAALRRAS